MAQYEVVFKKAVRKSMPGLPANVQERFYALVDVLENADMFSEITANLEKTNTIAI